MTHVADIRLPDALVARVAHQIGLDLAAGEPVDRDASFFDAGGFRFGGVDLDSMSFVEMLITLEDELGVALLDAADVAEFDSITRLAAYVEERAEPARVAALCRDWA